jgi:hypothetical protein
LDVVVSSSRSIGGLTEAVSVVQIYACRQSLPGHPEDHTLSTVHQMMEAWLEVASGLLQSVDNKAMAGNFELAAKSCWIVERVWKLAISQDGTAVSTEHIGGGNQPSSFTLHKKSS